MQSVPQTGYSYCPEPGYGDMMALLPRSSITADMGSSEIPHPHHVSISARSSVSHGHPHDQSLAYFLDGNCGATDFQNESKAGVALHSGVMPETHHHQMGNLSGDMLGGFQFQSRESALYPGLTPGWTFPSG